MGDPAPASEGSAPASPVLTYILDSAGIEPAHLEPSPSPTVQPTERPMTTCEAVWWVNDDCFVTLGAVGAVVGGLVVICVGGALCMIIFDYMCAGCCSRKPAAAVLG